MNDGKLHYVNNLAKHPESGVYLYRFSYKGQIRTGSTGCYRLEEARDYLAVLKSRLALEGIGIKKRRIRTFRQVYESWVKEIAPLRTKNYVRGMKSNITLHVLPLIGGFDVAKIDRSTIISVINSYLESGKARSSANTILTNLTTLLIYAAEEGRDWIPRVPKVPKLEIQKVARPIVTEEDLDAFLSAVDSLNVLDFSFMVRAQIYMGLRIDEAITMEWKGVRLNERVYIPSKTKNKDAPTMPIPDKMVPWFEKMAEKYGTFGYISPGRGKGKPHQGYYTNYWLSKLVAALEMSKKFTSHRLRATFANLLKQQNVPITTIQKLMRHSKVETTMIYIETREQEMRDAVNQL